MSGPVRVLVVDDSALMRKLIPKVLEADGSIKVVATAIDGSFGLKKIEELKPQVVTLDLEMPRMDGIEMMREITRRHRIPVIVFSAHSREGARATLKALSLGAFDFVTKPNDAASGHLDEIASELSMKIKAAARAGFPKVLVDASSSKIAAPAKKDHRHRQPTRVVAIGISTGGPNALHYLLSQLPSDFSGCFLVVQHMPQGFTDMLAKRLDENSALNVREARSGDPLLAGQVLICPGDRHLLVRNTPHGPIAVLSDAPRVNGHRPSAEVLFRSIAKELGPQAIAVLMTGMGDDGADAIGAVKARGGFTLAQDSGSCVVDSMPRSAIERGHIMRVVALEALPSILHSQCSEDPAETVQTASVGATRDLTKRRDSI
ncbi:MAG TPA: chemotaxis response regulator protein-glutamate methylesterase [Candidatus Acidoferrales bacterium]|nr:chemotaxis response regulator protein-glutamate methylesterase [Candidatus Acidoferrales bacterium]